MSSTPLNIALESLEAKRLQDRLQTELARRTWSEGEDDAVMSEYILVMVANKKTPAQISAELRDLIGEGDDTGVDVEHFVKWMWSVGEEITGRRGGGVAPLDDGAREVRQRSTHMSRRSASPEAHSGPSEPPRDQRRGAPFDRWDAEDRRKQAPRRELFATDEQQSGLMASDSMQEDTRQKDAQPNPRTQRRASQGNHELFPRSLREPHQSGRDVTTSSAQRPQQPPPPPLSIFARTGIPDPRAAEFVPQNSDIAAAPTAPTAMGSDNLLLRLDPMLPNNPPAPSEGTSTSTYVPEGYPTQPKETALCRWGVKCTAPTCVYSHASPSAVALARQTGEEPLVLNAAPCHYQKDCLRAECEFSHISPAVKFVLAKADRAAALAFGGGQVPSPSQSNSFNGVARTNDTASDVPPKSKLDTALGQSSWDTSATPCRYGTACFRRECHFRHPADRSTHISERLKTYRTDVDEGDMEVIIPVA